MAVSIDWGTNVINIPKADMTLVQTVPYEIRELDVNVFRLALKSLEDSSDGMAFPRTHKHNTTVSVGGVSLARVVEIINNYTITFEDGPYAVNLVAANSNVGDVVNLNQVSVRSGNSAGLVETGISGLTASESAQLSGIQAIPSEVWEEMGHNHLMGDSMGELLNSIHNNVEQSLWIEPAAAVNGNGSQQRPYDNMADILTTARTHGITKINVIGNLTLNGEDVTGLEFFGACVLLTNMVILPGTNTLECGFYNLNISGTFSLCARIESCIIGNINATRVFIQDSLLNGIVTVSSSTDSYIINSRDGTITGMAPVFDFNGSTQNLAMKGYTGNIIFRNKASASRVVVDLNPGNALIEASVTNGEFIISGIGSYQNNSTGITINSDNLIYNLGTGAFSAMG